MAVFGLIAMVLSGAALAQSFTHTVRAKIPFRFVADGKILQPGTYYLSFDLSHRNVVMIRNDQSYASFLTGSMGNQSTDDLTMLEFHTNDGELYALQAIKSPGFGVGFRAGKQLTSVARDKSNGTTRTLIAELVK